MQSRLAQLVLDHLSNARAFLHHDQLLVLEIVERDRLAGEAVAGRTGEYHLVPEERLEGDTTVAAGSADDAELELPVRHLVDERLSVGDGQPHAYVRVLFVELAKEERHDSAAGAGRSPELERPADRALVVGLELFEEMLLEREEPLRGGVEHAPGLGRFHTAPGAVEQLPPESLLERADLQADGRLRHPEALRGLGEALPLDHRAERSQLTRVHKRSLCKRIRVSDALRSRTWRQSPIRATPSACGSPS